LAASPDGVVFKEKNKNKIDKIIEIKCLSIIKNYTEDTFFNDVI
jgi:hypothetical protein